jgi:hypothetical protein
MSGREAYADAGNTTALKEDEVFWHAVSQEALPPNAELTHGIWRRSNRTVSSGLLSPFCAFSIRTYVLKTILSSLYLYFTNCLHTSIGDFKQKSIT